MRPATCAAVALLSACQLPLGVDDGEVPLLRTSLEQYELEIDGEWARLSVPYTFSNRTDVTVHINGCRGQVAPLFEREVDGEWEYFYQAPTLSCLSPPRPIRSGSVASEVGHLTLRMTSDATASDRYVPGTVNGRYRLRWMTATHGSFLRYGYTEQVTLPLELTISNSFTIVEPRPN